MPYERVILLILAVFRALFTFNAGALGFYTGSRAFGDVFAYALGCLFAVCGSLVSADVIEHHAKRWLLGYSYNPYVMAIGEWEGWTGPTTGDPAGREVWEQVKCGPPPGGSAHPLMPWWGNPGSSSWCKQKGTKP